MNKRDCLKEASRRGHFTKEDADAFGKAMVFVTASDLSRLEIDPSEAAASGFFYRLAACDVEPELILEGKKLGFRVRDNGDHAVFSLI